MKWKELKMTSQVIIDKLRRARVQMMKRFPFFGYLSMYLQFVETDEVEVNGKKKKLFDTMAVDNHGHMYYNPEFIKKLSEQELIGVLAHEIMHVANGHHERLKNRDRNVWNVATDVIINRLLKLNGMQLPKGALTKESINKYVKIDKPEEIPSEELYQKLYDKIPKEYVGFDYHIYGNGKGNDKKETTAQKKYRKNQWKNRICEAVQRAKQKGNVPAGMKRYIDELLEPKIHWKTLLMKYITKEIPFDYGWNRPSKKSISAGVYLPSIIKESMQLIVSIDTSGSMGKKDLAEAFGEIIGIIRAYPFVKMTAIVCDAEIHRVYELTNTNADEVKKLALEGGGGTSHIPVYNWIKDNKPMARLLINLTDGYTTFPNDDLGINSLWVITSNGCDEKNIPFGRVIKIGGN